jgi:hypothetical protein
VLWRGGDHVALKQLVEDFAKYLYLPRLAGPEILVEAVRDGIALLTWAQDTFAYADSRDEADGRYRGLIHGRVVNLSQDSPGLLVKPDVATRQLQSEPQSTSGSGGVPSTPGTGGSPTTGGTGGTQPATPALPRRFFGTVQLDPTRVGRDAGRIADEVIAHLAGQIGADVIVTLEIQATLPSGANDQLVRTVTENSRTLKFTTHGFESD